MIKLETEAGFVWVKHGLILTIVPATDPSEPIIGRCEAMVNGLGPVVVFESAESLAGRVVDD